MRNTSPIVLFALVLSCQSEATQEVIPIYYSRTESDKIWEIRLPDDVLPTSPLMKPYTNSNKEELLYYYNPPKFEIIIFNLDDVALQERIGLSKEGPNGIGVCRGFTVIDDDKLIISGLNSDLFVVDHSGQVVKKINYSTDESLHFPVSLGKKEVYFTSDSTMIIPYDVSPRDADGIMLENDDKADVSLFSTYRDGKIEPLEIYVPSRENEVNHPNHPWQTSTTFHNNTLYWTFSTSKNIYYSSDLKEIQEMIFSPSEMPRANSLDPMSLGPFLTLVRTTRYGSLMYQDGKYYQMVRYGVEEDEMAGLEETHIARYPNKFAVLIFNQDLNFEKEIRFRGTEYHYGMCFYLSKRIIPFS